MDQIMEWLESMHANSQTNWPKPIWPSIYLEINNSAFLIRSMGTHGTSVHVLLTVNIEQPLVFERGVRHGQIVGATRQHFAIVLHARHEADGRDGGIPILVHTVAHVRAQPFGAQPPRDLSGRPRAYGLTLELSPIASGQYPCGRGCGMVPGSGQHCGLTGRRRRRWMWIGHFVQYFHFQWTNCRDKRKPALKLDVHVQFKWKLGSGSSYGLLACWTKVK